MGMATEIIGYVASTSVLVTFCMRSMRSLNVVAISNNLAFILCIRRWDAPHPDLAWYTATCEHRATCTSRG